MDPISMLRPAMRGFEKVMREVRDEHFSMPTPCSEWDVRALVAHVVWGNAAVPSMLSGSALDDVPASQDPLTDWAATAEAAVVALERPGVAKAIVDHPLGKVPGELLAYFRVTDHLIHAWDLARSIDVDDSLDPELVQYCLEGTRPFADFLASSDQFAAQVPVPDDADAQTQLIALHGRDPSWRPVLSTR